MRRAALAVAIVVCCCGLPRAEEKKSEDKDADGWISIFDGKTLKGWKASEKPDNWTAEDGCIVGQHDRSHLFYMDKEFGDLEFKAEVKINKGGNSGMFFRTAFGDGWPKGYEAQVNSSHTDPVRSGSLYYLVKIGDKLTNDDEWFTQHIVAKGNHIMISINGKKVVDFVDEKETYKKGYVALQQHNEGSVVKYRKLMVKPLDK
jgi:hypothetical protein